MTSATSSEHFELVFEGLSDQNPKTLQVLKGVFIAELEYSMSDVQNFLAHAPITIQKDAKRENLEVAFERLKKAGAKVQIVAPRVNTSTIEQVSSESRTLGKIEMDQSLWSDDHSAHENVLAPSSDVLSALSEALDLDLEPATPSAENRVEALDDENRIIYSEKIHELPAIEDDEPLFVVKQPEAPKSQEITADDDESLFGELIKDVKQNIELSSPKINSTTVSPKQDSPIAKPTSTSSTPRLEPSAPATALSFSLDDTTPTAPAPKPAPKAEIPLAAKPVVESSLSFSLDDSPPAKASASPTPKTPATPQIAVASPAPTSSFSLSEPEKPAEKPAEKTAVTKSAEPAPNKPQVALDVAALDLSLSAPEPAAHIEAVTETPKAPAQQATTSPEATGVATSTVDPALDDLPLKAKMKAKAANPMAKPEKSEIPAEPVNEQSEQANEDNGTVVNAVKRTGKKKSGSGLRSTIKNLPLPLDIVVPVLIGAGILFLFHLYNYYASEPAVVPNLETFPGRPSTPKRTTPKAQDAAPSGQAATTETAPTEHQPFDPRAAAARGEAQPGDRPSNALEDSIRKPLEAANNVKDAVEDAQKKELLDDAQ